MSPLSHVSVSYLGKKENLILGAWGDAQQLRMFTALAEDWSFIVGGSQDSRPSVTSAAGYLALPSGLQRNQYACVCTDTQIKHKIFLFKKIKKLLLA